MPNLSEIAEKLPASPIRKLVPYAQRAKAKGVKVYHLNIGQPDIETPQEALAAVAENKARVLAYTHSAGVESYRESLANFYNSRGLNLTQDDIMVTTGGSEALFFSMLTVCDPGDEVIVPEPFYANYNSFAVEAGVVIVPITSVIEDGFALPSISAFEELITERTKAVLICNPNNPTGYLYSKQEIEALRDLVVKRNLFLISDEVYSDFCYDGKQHYSVLKLEGVDENVIMCDSVSKRYSMCGVRVGTVVSRNKEVLDAMLRMGQARLCAPMLGQLAASGALNAPKSYYDTVREEYKSRRDVVVEALSRMEGVLAPCPAGAFYVIARLPVDNTEKFAQWILEEFSYEGATVMLAPAQGFYSNPKACVQNEVRIAYVLERDELRGAMRVLEEALRVYNNR